MVRKTCVIAALVGLGVAGSHAGTLAQERMAAPQKVATVVAPPVNLNTATAAQLEGLPGVGPALAARILEYRQKNGSFKKVEDLMNVKGIGEKSFLKLKPLVTVTPPKGTER